MPQIPVLEDLMMKDVVTQPTALLKEESEDGGAQRNHGPAAC